MKKIFYLAGAVAALGMIASCESEPKNPGDFNLPSEVSLGEKVICQTNGKEFPLKVAREIDTVYRYEYTVRDTLKDENDDPVVNSDGSLNITESLVYIDSKIKARYIEMETVMLPAKADTFYLDINSNARWFAAVPDDGGKAPWFFNHNSTTTGGGDSHMEFRVTRNRASKRAIAKQYIITSDSTTMYMIPFDQYSEKNQPADL